VPAAGDVPYDTLRVKIESFEKENRVWILELSYLPGLEDDLQGVSILQCYVAVSEHNLEANRIGLEQLMLKVNAKLPIGNFGLLDDPQVLFFKHNAMVPNDNDAASYQIVHELVPMTSYLLTTFSEPLVRIATGHKTVDAALDKRPFGTVTG
jgi:hypothetical protein